MKILPIEPMQSTIKYESESAQVTLSIDPEQVSRQRRLQSQAMNALDAIEISDIWVRACISTLRNKIFVEMPWPCDVNYVLPSVNWGLSCLNQYIFNDLYPVPNEDAFIRVKNVFYRWIQDGIFVLNFNRDKIYVNGDSEIRLLNYNDVIYLPLRMRTPLYERLITGCISGSHLDLSEVPANYIVCYKICQTLHDSIFLPNTDIPRKIPLLGIFEMETDAGYFCRSLLALLRLLLCDP